MMRSSLAAFLALAVVASAHGLAVAGTSSGNPCDQGGKIGYVDFNRALNQVADGRNAKKRLADEFREKQQQLEKKQESVALLKEKIDKDRMFASGDEIKTREEEYRGKFFDLQQTLSAFQSEMESRESKLTADILSRLKGIVGEIGSDEGYCLILEKSQDVVLFAQPGSDLTQRVVTAYDGGRGSGKR